MTDPTQPDPPAWSDDLPETGRLVGVIAIVFLCPFILLMLAAIVFASAGAEWVL